MLRVFLHGYLHQNAYIHVYIYIYTHLYIYTYIHILCKSSSPERLRYLISVFSNLISTPTHFSFSQVSDAGTYPDEIWFITQDWHNMQVL